MEGGWSTFPADSGQLSDMEDSHPAYSISKTALNAVTRQLASALGKERDRGQFTVCPGWVKTDMGGEGAHRDGRTGRGHTGLVGHGSSEVTLTGEFSA